MKAITYVLNPVGLIGSPGAIRAYLAHEAKKRCTAPECPGCDDLTMYYPAIDRGSVLNIVLKLQKR